MPNMRSPRASTPIPRWPSSTTASQNELAATPITQNVDINLAASLRRRVGGGLRPDDHDRGPSAGGDRGGGGGRPAQPVPGLRRRLGPVPGTRAGLRPASRLNHPHDRSARATSADDRNAFRTLVGFRGDLTDALTYDALLSLCAHPEFADPGRQHLPLGVHPAGRQRRPATCSAPTSSAPPASTGLSILAQNQDISQLQVAQASVSGPLFQLGSANDPVAFAAGVEWRSMGGQFIPDTALSSGDVVGFNAGQPDRGRL